MGLKINLDGMQSWLSMRNVLILGVLVSIGVSASEFLRGEHANYMIFANSTRDFWNGISPYSDAWWRHGLDFFLYAPPFSVLFAPFASMPDWLGVFVWNVFNYTLYALSIFTLPRISDKTKAYILLYTLPILGAGQLDFQYNIAIAYMFLFAFTLLETGRGKWAMLIIMASAMTKIYGGFELLLVLLYPKFWKNVMWGALWAILIFMLPVIKLGPSGLFDYYGEWFTRLMQHSGTRPFETFFDIKLLWGDLAVTGIHTQYQAHIQLFVIAVITALTFLRLKWRENFNFRVGLLAVVTGYVILFGSGTEKHTYIIGLVAYLYWWWSKNNKKTIDKIFYWSIFAIIVLVPVDVIVPKQVMLFLLWDLDLNKWLFLAAWLYVCYDTFVLCGKSEQNTIKEKR